VKGTDGFNGRVQNDGTELNETPVRWRSTDCTSSAHCCCFVHAQRNRTDVQRIHFYSRLFNVDVRLYTYYANTFLFTAMIWNKHSRTINTYISDASVYTVFRNEAHLLT